MTFLVNVLLTTLFCIGLNDPGETTNEPIVDEPMIYIYEIYIPLIQN